MSEETEPGHAAPAAFDREIHLKGILYSAAGLIAVTILALAAMWWLLLSFAGYDTRHDVKKTPVETANPQGPPPEPRLQVAPGFNLFDRGLGGKALEQSDREDMAAQKAAEERALAEPAVIDPARGTLRVPIEVAMRVIAARGVAPEVVGGHAGAPSGAPPVPSVQVPQNLEQAGTRQPTSSQPPPVPEERR
jgi:hypothetical protein